MAIISQETWDNMSNEEKDKIVKKYNWYQEKEVAEAILEFEDLFGKENLHPKPKIKTWSDVAIHKSEIWDEIHKVITTISGCSRIGNKILNKLIATIQIQKLIELGYGGVVTEEEWDDKNVWKYCVASCVQPDNNKKIRFVSPFCIGEKRFIAFHTPEQRELFMSFPENRKLVEQYYMI